MRSSAQGPPNEMKRDNRKHQAKHMQELWKISQLAASTSVDARNKDADHSRNTVNQSILWTIFKDAKLKQLFPLFVSYCQSCSEPVHESMRPQNVWKIGGANGKGFTSMHPGRAALDYAVNRDRERVESAGFSAVLDVVLLGLLWL